MNYFLAAVGSIFITVITGLTWKLQKVEKDNIGLRLDLSIAEINNRTLDSALEELNILVESQRIAIDTFVPVTVTEVVTEYVPKYINVERGDCNDTHNYLDYLSTIKL